MIFAPNFVASLVAIQQEWADNAMVHCACWDLPERIEERDYDREDFPMLSAAGARRETSGTGACQFARRAFFHEVRGYDEGYQHWGAEDVDMSSRATRYGLEIVWASARTQMLHQWHPTMKHERSWNRRLNNWRFKLTKTWVVKNRSSWGGRP